MVEFILELTPEELEIILKRFNIKEEDLRSLLDEKEKRLDIPT